jgi:4-carboxymuconolactone decarboxylase
VQLITDREQATTDEQRQTFDWVVESRGRMIRPFEVLLHTPAMAREVAELGAKVRFESSLKDHDRELVIITAAHLHGCAFEWDSHLPLARQAGVREDAITAIRAGQSADLTQTEELLIGFVRQLCTESTVSEERFIAARHYLGESGVVELCVTVGYYTLLAMVMGATDACD